jgi:uncharacterized protein (TIGR02099 family)
MRCEFAPGRKCRWLTRHDSGSSAGADRRDWARGMQTEEAQKSRRRESWVPELERRAGALSAFWGVLEVLLWIVFFGAASVMLGVRYWLLPDIERYRGDIVAGISRAIGLPVKIGGIEAGWLGLRPQLALTDVRIYDREGREALVLPSVDNVVSWSSIVFRDLRLHTLTIDSPRLEIRRAADGVFYVAGMRIDREDGNGRMADWVLGQREIVIRNAEIRWTDEVRRAPTLELAAVDFRLSNRGDVHAFGLSARPPPTLGSLLDLRGELVGESITDPSQWDGRLYAELGYTDLAGWRSWVDYPLDVRAGQGALRVWATLAKGRLQRATTDLALSRASVRVAPELPVLELASVRGRLQGRVDAGAYELGGKDFALALAGGSQLPASSFRLAWRPASGTAPAEASFASPRIDLKPLAVLAEYLPLPAAAREGLRDAQPEGQLLETEIRWVGGHPANADAAARPGGTSIKSRFSGLAMKALGNMPGFRALSGSIDADAERGSVRLVSNHASIDLPGIFPEPRIALASLAGRVEWKHPAGGALNVKLAEIVFANEHLAGTLSGSYGQDQAGAGSIDLTASLERADARYTAKYLPGPAIMGVAAREWVAAAVQAGNGSDVRLRLKGRLADFPYVDPATGSFLVTARVREAVVQPLPGWPRIEAVDGQLKFERNAFSFEGRSGRVFGARLSNVRVTVPALHADRHVVSIAGTAEGPTAEFLRYVAVSPLRRLIDGATDGFAATGPGRLQLRMELPLEDLERSRLNGEFQFANNALVFDSQLPPLERATGRVGFTDAGVSIPEIRGVFLGGPVQLSGGPRGPGNLVVNVRGDVQAQNLRPLFDHPLRRFISGSAAYSAVIFVNRERTQVTVESGLRGIASALPAPLAKRGDELLPLRVDLLTSDAGTRDRISVSLGRLASAEFLRRRQGDAMQVQRAAVVLSPVAGQPVRVPERPGTLVYGSLAALDLDRWRAVLPAGEAGAASAELSVGTLDLYGRRLHEVEIRAGADGTGWATKLKSREIAGEIAYRPEGGGRVIARLEHFKVPDVYPGAPEGDAVKELPAVDFIAERMVLRGKQYGRVELLAHRSGQDWRIDKLSSVNPESALSAKGVWRAGAEAKTSLSFDLQASDTGKFLDRVGYPNLLKGGKAKLTGAVAWNGDPVTIDYGSMQGDLVLEASDGQFVEIEPGIGKLVSLMSLQMLPRRITLDFSDVFSKGFQFDRINSSMRIERGVLRTSDFKMRGSAAEVDMSGETNLARETQSLRVRVVPSLGDSASTLISALGGPIAGVATMLAQRVLRNPLGQIFSYEFAISGTWSDPKVEKVANSVPKSTPDGATPGG